METTLEDIKEGFYYWYSGDNIYKYENDELMLAWLSEICSDGDARKQINRYEKLVDFIAYLNESGCDYPTPSKEDFEALSTVGMTAYALLLKAEDHGDPLRINNEKLLELLRKSEVGKKVKTYERFLAVFEKLQDWGYVTKSPPSKAEFEFENTIGRAADSFGRFWQKHRENPMRTNSEDLLAWRRVWGGKEEIKTYPQFLVLFEYLKTLGFGFSSVPTKKEFEGASLMARRPQKLQRSSQKRENAPGTISQ